MKRVLIISHADEHTGAVDRYADYLATKGCSITKVVHPLSNYSDQPTKIIEGTTVKAQHKRSNIGPLNLVIDLLISLRVAVFSDSTTVIGANNFDTIPAVIAKWLTPWKHRKAIFFASDFSNKRFKSGLMNSIYMLAERFVLKTADTVVSNSQRSQDRRIQLGLVPSRGVIVFNVASVDGSAPRKKQLSTAQFFFVGSLTVEHGLRSFLECCAPLIQSINVVGVGPEENKIRQLCSDRKIKATFHGEKDNAWVMNYMQEFEGIGLAPYSRDGEEYVTYGSSMKIYEYIACGLPVITSDVTEQSALVSEYGLGIVYSRLDEQQIGAGLASFDTQHFADRAAKFCKAFNQQTQFSKVQL